MTTNSRGYRRSHGPGARTRAWRPAGCGKYSFGALKAQKAFKDGNDLYSAAGLEEGRREIRRYRAAEPTPTTAPTAYFYLGNSYDNLFKSAEPVSPKTTPTSRRRSTTTRRRPRTTRAAQMKKLALEYLVAAYGPDKLNDPAKAEPVVQKMIQLEPNEPTNYFALAKIYEDAAATTRPKAQMQGPRRQAERPDCVYTDNCRLLQPPGRLREDDRSLEQGGRAGAQQPEGYQLVATYYWEKASKDHRLTDAEKKDYIEQGLDNVNKALQLNPELRRCAGLQGPALPPAGACREGQGEAEAAARRSRRAAEAGDRAAQEDRGILTPGSSSTRVKGPSAAMRPAFLPVRGATWQRANVQRARCSRASGPRATGNVPTCTGPGAAGHALAHGRSHVQPVGASHVEHVAPRTRHVARTPRSTLHVEHVRTLHLARCTFRTFPAPRSPRA